MKIRGFLRPCVALHKQHNRQRNNVAHHKIVITKVYEDRPSTRQKAYRMMKMSEITT